MKSFKAILLAFLLVLCMIVSPVMGYDLVGETTVTGKTSYVNVSAAIFMNGTSNWSDVKYLTWEGSDNFGGSWSYPNQKICRDTSDVQVGTAALTVSGTTVTIETNFTAAPQNGRNYIWSSCFNGAENSLYPFKQKASTSSSEYSTQPYGFSFSYPGASAPYNGVYQAFTGTSLNPPVADFSCNPFWTVMGNMTLCSYTGTGGEPDTYLWEAWRPYEDPGYDDPMTSEYDNLGVQVNYFGWYPVNLTVCNEAGCSYDFTFGFKGIYSDNMTQLNITPQQTIALIPTGIVNIVNATKLREDALNTSIGNLSIPFLNTVDFFADGVNASFSEIIGIFTIPLSWMTGALTGVTSDINNIAVPLVSQSTIFLNVMGRSLAALPTILINIVTLALLLDIVRIVIRGVGGM